MGELNKRLAPVESRQNQPKLRLVAVSSPGSAFGHKRRTQRAVALAAQGVPPTHKHTG